jgi:hypothetical protein
MPRESVKMVIEQPFSRSRGDDRSIADLAGRQHGVVGRTQLMRDGWSEQEIKWRTRAGRLHRVHAGVYSVAPRQLLTRQGWWMAAVLASGPEALLSHYTAAALWGIRGYSGGAVHVTVPTRAPRRSGSAGTSRSSRRTNRWDRLSLPDLLERYRGKRGSRKLRFALERLKEEPPGRKRSKLEERFAPFLRRYHLPLPRFF